jgi:hypothetical protein
MWAQLSNDRQGISSAAEHGNDRKHEANYTTVHTYKQTIPYPISHMTLQAFMLF